MGLIINQLIAAVVAGILDPLVLGSAVVVSLTLWSGLMAHITERLQARLPRRGSTR